MANYRVVLDYGHGGSKPGAAYNGIEEKTVNLLLGQSIYAALWQQSTADRTIQVMLTRDSDYDIPISVRLQLINLHHQQRPIHLVCSIHHNAANTTAAHGFEAYYSEHSPKGRMFCESVAQQVGYLGVYLRNGGILTTVELGRRLAMIHKTIPPSILIEAGYLTNSKDMANATHAGYREKLAGSIAGGIWSALRNGEKQV